MVADLILLSIAKAVVHSWITPDRHRNSKADETGRFRIQNFAFSDTGGKGLKGLVLLFGQHGFSSLTDAIHFKGVNIKQLRTEKLVLVSSPAHPLAHQTDFALTSLTGHTLLLPKTD